MLVGSSVSRFQGPLHLGLAGGPFVLLIAQMKKIEAQKITLLKVTVINSD